MKVDLSGEIALPVLPERLWTDLNDPELLTRCIPGCRSMTATKPDSYDVVLELKVAAVGGSFEGKIALTDKEPPRTCRITVSGAGTLGNGTGTAQFVITPQPDGTSQLAYEGVGEVGGLVAGVGQRILRSVAKHLAGQFFKNLRKEYERPAAAKVTS